MNYKIIFNLGAKSHKGQETTIFWLKKIDVEQWNESTKEHALSTNQLIVLIINQFQTRHPSRREQLKPRTLCWCYYKIVG